MLRIQMYDLGGKHNRIRRALEVTIAPDGGSLGIGGRKGPLLINVQLVLILRLCHGSLQVGSHLLLSIQQLCKRQNLVYRQPLLAINTIVRVD